MDLPKHVCLSISHNQHKGYYETVEEYLNRDHADVAPGDRADMIAMDEVWEIQWYPDTPVAFCCVAAATLERALELANG